MYITGIVLYVHLLYTVQVEEGYHVLFNFTDIVTGSSSSYVRIRLFLDSDFRYLEKMETLKTF